MKSGPMAMIAALAILGSTSIEASEPNIVNARIERVTPEGSLQNWVDRQVEALQSPTWIAYSVPMLEGAKSSCCCSGGGWTDCGLETGESVQIGSNETDRSVDLEASKELVVFLRAAEGRIQRIRFYSAACLVDAGGRTVFWLGAVDPERSLALLDSIVIPRPSSPALSRRLWHGAVAAIAFHAAPRASELLAGYASDSGESEHLRKQAVFWAGELHQPKSLSLLRQVIAADPSLDVRKQAVFAISLGSGDEAKRTLIELARTNNATEVRKTALFWLGQKAGRAASETLTEAVDSDPEVEVRKQAVFGISQLPPDEGIPLLIRIARTNRTPAVRKAAMFWLGQSDRPEVIDFFEEILRNP